MKSLIWYCKNLAVTNIQQMKNSENVCDNNSSEIMAQNVIVPWVTIESESDYNYFEDFLTDLKKVSKRFKTNKIVIIPFAHFANKLPPYSISFRIINDLGQYLEKNGFETKRAHFGSAKDLMFFSPADKYQVIARQYPEPSLIKRL